MTLEELQAEDDALWSKFVEADKAMLDARRKWHEVRVQVLAAREQQRINSLVEQKLKEREATNVEGHSD